MNFGIFYDNPGRDALLHEPGDYREPATTTARSTATRGSAEVQIKYATRQLHYPVWGMSPSSTADDTGNYGGYGVEGLAFPY
jgi:hypothetical protein